MKLYISDLDGTLLDARGELSMETRRILVELLEGGMPFTVASARSHFSISKIFGSFPFRLPVIEYNGAFITDFSTGRHLETNGLGKDLTRALYDRILARGQSPFVASFDGQRDRLHYDSLRNPAMVWYEGRRRGAGDPRLTVTPDLYDTLREDVIGLTIMAEDAGAIEALHHELEAEFGEVARFFRYENEYSKGAWWLTVHHLTASKHLAMLRLRELYAPGAQIVAVGDNVNDLEMLAHADFAVAVDNAVPAVKARAARVIGDHTEDAVARFLVEQFRG